MNSLIRFLPFLLAVVLVAAFGGLFAPGDWYASLDKPPWNPPSWVFAPVWSLLYLMMAVAAWMVWESSHEKRLRALTWWGIQLLLNGAWSWLFFGLHRPGWAFAEMLVLFAAIAITFDRFRRVRPAAAYLLIPYLAWVAFALLLNLTLWQLNGGDLARALGSMRI